MRQVKLTVQQTLKAWGVIAQMHAHDAVFQLAATTQPLPRGTGRMHAALGGSRFVQAADRLRVSVFAGNQLLAFVPHTGFLPLDRFHETL